VIRQAWATAAQWPGNLCVAVNISAAQFRNPGLMQHIVGALAASGLHPTRLEIEITESVLLQNREATLATLHQLRSLGIRIAMDDFGTGYSSLTYLQCFPFDKIKIDRSFVHLNGNGTRPVLLRSIVALAHDLNMEVVAEGVESVEIGDALRSMGCDLIQGYHVCRPVSAQNYQAWYSSWSSHIPADTRVLRLTKSASG